MLNEVKSMQRVKWFVHAWTKWPINLKVKMLFVLLLTLTSVSAQTHQQVRKQETDPFARYVTHLDSVDRVELIVLKYLPLKAGKIPDDPTIERMVPGLWPQRRVGSILLKGADAQKMRQLWRRLQRGNGFGCFSPGYIADFYSGKDRILRASICFHCCNIATDKDNAIASICGDSDAFKALEIFVTEKLPLPKDPKPDKERPNDEP